MQVVCWVSCSQSDCYMKTKYILHFTLKHQTEYTFMNIDYRRRKHGNTTRRWGWLSDEQRNENRSFRAQETRIPVNRLESFGLRFWHWHRRRNQQLSGASDDIVNRRNNDGDGYRSLQRMWEHWYEGAGYSTGCVNHDIDGTVCKSPTVARIFDCEFYSKIWDVQCTTYPLYSYTRW